MKNTKHQSFPALTRKILKQKQCNLPQTWQLRESHIPLYCEEIIRMMPGKRIVAFGLWEGKKVVIKIFFAKDKAKQQGARDVQGVVALMEGNVPTPKLLYHGIEDKSRVYVAIYERILPAKSVAQYLEQDTIQSVLPLLKDLTLELATQHVLGILQKDLHLKNFLVQGSAILTLDGGQIEKFDNPLDEQRSLKYICLYLAQLGVGVENIQQELFLLYAKSRGLIVTTSLLQRYRKTLKQMMLKRGERYKKKVFRTSSAFQRVDTWRRTFIYDRAYASVTLLDFLQNPEKFFTHPEAVFLKKGRSSTVVKIKIDPYILVIKRYNLKSLWHRLRRCVRPSRAVNMWRMAQYVFAAGIKTAKPVAYIENHLGVFRGKSYFIMEYVSGQNIGEYFSTFFPQKPLYTKVAQEVLKLIRDLAALKIIHGDLKMTNILIDEKYQPVLIDLDGIRQYKNKYLLHSALKNEIKRFMRNWQALPLVYDLFKGLLQKN